jgi:hypothetical protein
MATEAESRKCIAGLFGNFLHKELVAIVMSYIPSIDQMLEYTKDCLIAKRYELSNLENEYFFLKRMKELDWDKRNLKRFYDTVDDVENIQHAKQLYTDITGHYITRYAFNIIWDDILRKRLLSRGSH